MLAKDKGVHREVESEGSLRQTLELTNRNRILGVSNRDEIAFEIKVRYCTEVRGVYAEAT